MTMKFFKRFTKSKPKLDKKGAACETPKEAIEVEAQESRDPEATKAVTEEDHTTENELDSEETKAEEATPETHSDAKEESAGNAEGEKGDGVPKLRTIDTTVTEDAVEAEVIKSPIEAATEAVHNAAEAAHAATQSFMAAVTQTLSTTFNPTSPTSCMPMAPQLQDSPAASFNAPEAEAEKETEAEADAVDRSTCDDAHNPEDDHGADQKKKQGPAPTVVSKKILDIFKGFRHKKQKEEDQHAAADETAASKEKTIEVEPNLEDSKESEEKPMNEKSPDEKQIEEKPVEEMNPVEENEATEEKKTAEEKNTVGESTFSSAMHSIAKSFSMNSVGSHRSSVSKRSGHVSKSFSNLSAKKSRSFDTRGRAEGAGSAVSSVPSTNSYYDTIESKSSVQSEISGLVRFMSHRENVERGFEVLLEDFDGFNKSCVGPSANEQGDEKDDDSVVQLLQDADRVVLESEHREEVSPAPEPAEPEQPSEEKTQEEDLETETKEPTGEVEEKPSTLEAPSESTDDGEDEHREFIPPQLSMRSHTSKASKASRVSKKSVSSRLSRRKSDQHDAHVESEKPEMIEIPTASSNLSKRSTKSTKSVKSLLPLPLQLQRSSSAVSHKSTVSTSSKKSVGLIQKSESNVSKKPASVPTMSTASQPELIAAKSSKSFIIETEEPSVADSAAACTTPEEIDAPQASAVITSE